MIPTKLEREPPLKVIVLDSVLPRMLLAIVVVFVAKVIDEFIKALFPEVEAVVTLKFAIVLPEIDEGLLPPDN